MIWLRGASRCPNAGRKKRSGRRVFAGESEALGTITCLSSLGARDCCLLDTPSAFTVYLLTMEYDLKDLFRQAARIQEKIKEIQEQLSRRTVTVDTGGGMVTVTVNGRQEVVSIKLDPQCVDPRDIPMLEDLILTAVNLGMKRSRELAAEEMKHLTGPYPLPFTVT